MNQRLTVGIDGNCIYVGLGDLPEGDFVFEEFISNGHLRDQANKVVESWYKTFPQHGRLPFDYVDGL